MSQILTGSLRLQGAPLGPGSRLWATASDPRSLMPGLATGIMQLMHPGLGAGVTDHSDFFNDPFGRILRSIPAIWGGIFATDDTEGDERGHFIRDLHKEIKGTDDHGRRYHALDPDIFWWAHATFTWEFFRAHELYFPRRLRRSEKERLYAETVTWYRRYGVSERPVPPDYRAFRKRFHQICAHQLEITPAVQWVLDMETNPVVNAPESKLPRPIEKIVAPARRAGLNVVRVMVYGTMPDVLRRRFGFAWTDTDRLVFAQLCVAMRAMGPAIRRGALDSTFPEGTPHLAHGSHNRIVVAGPSRTSMFTPALA